jgi:hypothetical protein
MATLATTIANPRRLAENYLVQLAMLDAEGRHGSPEYGRLYDGLCLLESKLSPADMKFIQNLSSDLYMIEDDEVYDEPREGMTNWAELARTLQDRYYAKDWDELLLLLRQPALEMPVQSRAFLRARAYDALDLHAAAWAFYTYAAKVSDDRPVYQYFALNNLKDWNPDAAFKQAQSVVPDSTMHPAVRLLSASIVLLHYRGVAEYHTVEIRQLAVALLPVLGEAAHQKDVPLAVLNLGYSTLAGCLDTLKDYSSAAFVYGMMDPAGADDMLQNEINRMRNHVRRGEAVPSGVLIDPASIEITEQDRVEGLDDLARKAVEELLPAAA